MTNSIILLMCFSQALPNITPASPSQLKETCLSHAVEEATSQAFDAQKMKCLHRYNIDIPTLIRSGRHRCIQVCTALSRYLALSVYRPSSPNGHVARLFRTNYEGQIAVSESQWHGYVYGATVTCTLGVQIRPMIARDLVKTWGFP